jgi:hypothetical protein
MEKAAVPWPTSWLLVRLRARRGIGVALAGALLVGCVGLSGSEAADDCFPPGTALSFSGRTTTAALDVQEVVGDPMSHQLADIFITRDAFDQGALHGRLVCAIYVETGFVEVTVHPADGGRVLGVPLGPSIPPTPLPSGQLEIVTHCGLDFVRIEWEGDIWRFDADDQPNPPPGWGFNTTIVEIEPGPSGPIVTGPDGSRWELIRADPADAPGMCL